MYFQGTKAKSEDRISLKQSRQGDQHFLKIFRGLCFSGNKIKVSLPSGISLFKLTSRHKTGTEGNNLSIT
jgi:hypothetical protein